MVLTIAPGGSAFHQAAACRVVAKVPPRLQEHEVELVGRHVEDHAVADHPGVVDHAVQAAEVLDGRGDQPASGLEVADVVAEGERPAALGGDRRRRLLGPGEVVDDHRGPGTGAGQRLLRPIPCPAPVTITTLPSSTPMRSSLGPCIIPSIMRVAVLEELAACVRRFPGPGWWCLGTPTSRSTWAEGGGRAAVEAGIVPVT